MSKAIIGAAAVVLAAIGVSHYAQNQANAALRREIAGLRDDLTIANAAAKARAAVVVRSETAEPSPGNGVVNALPPAANDELAKLREEISALRKSTTTLTQLAQMAGTAQALAKSGESVATNLIPASQLKNAGKATPEATTETALWAAVGGDIDALAGSLTFTESARAKADAWFAGLSDSTRQQYGSAEKIMALMIARDAASLTGMQVLGQKEVTPNDVGVRVRFAAGEKVKDDTFLMHRTADGWRMVLPDAAVEKFARQVGGGK